MMPRVLCWSSDDGAKDVRLWTIENLRDTHETTCKSRGASHMNEVASLELSRELCEISGWDDTYLAMNIYNDKLVKRRPEFSDVHVPAYSLGYLLRKLPPRIQDSHGTWFSLMGFPNGTKPWFAYKSSLDGEKSRWPNDKGIPYYKRVFEGDTPEDAAAKLCIELINQGLLAP